MDGKGLLPALDQRYPLAPKGSNVTPVTVKFYRHQHCAPSGHPGRVFLSGGRGWGRSRTDDDLNTQCRLKETHWWISGWHWVQQ